jgi:anti-sigma regulatory factor (Ser/Thr protein kinase)
MAEPPTPAPELVRHWSLPADPEVASRVRSEVLQQCADWHVDPKSSADVALVADELLTNAVQHGRGPLLMTVRAGTTHVYVGVVVRAPDASPGVAVPDAESESGRGLAVVDALSTSWGTAQQAAASKLVWATVPASLP